MPKQTLAETRAYSTDEERKVLALEAIADQLRLLVEVLRPTGDLAPADGTPKNGSDLRAASA